MARCGAPEAIDLSGVHDGQMRRVWIVVVLGTFALGACGGGDDEGATSATDAPDESTEEAPEEEPGGGDIDVCALVADDTVAAVLGAAATSAADDNPDDANPSCTWLTDDPVGPSLRVDLVDHGGLDTDAWLEAQSNGQTDFEAARHVGHGNYTSRPSDRMVQAGVLLDDDAAIVVAYAPPPDSPDPALVEAVLFDIAGNR